LALAVSAMPSHAKPTIHPTPWGSILLAKLTVTQLFEKFPIFYGTLRFITVFTTACHWSLSWARCIQCTPSHHFFSRCILILPYHLCQSLPLHYMKSVLNFTILIKPCSLCIKLLCNIWHNSLSSIPFNLNIFTYNEY
jgi:hypothetical protein